MTKTKLTSGLDQDFLRAYADSTSRQSTASVNVVSVGKAQLTVKVSMMTSASTVKASFDPVSSERALNTRMLNQAARLGFRPPKSSTR